ncbi:hypothetical protein QBC41DRAFT_369494 [Cercophora samala]|uniref:Uncharacterized protein n=1 Tax=Cercophora samala TaxID=330535 RepID=A0AA39ZP48_9PEZI|nr:hypothetical protein QBC41DRAFT_369494 [Cercophora samala]
MKLFTLLLTTFSLFLSPTSANTEKTIFLGPEPVQLPPNDHSIFLILTKLPRLTPLPTNKSTLRTLIPISFPNASHPTGSESWYLLDNLTPHQRYEVRICWAATQPTSFNLQTHPITTPLPPSLTPYLSSLPPSPFLVQMDTDYPEPRNLLLLRLHAAADFYTTNQTLMSDPPPVIANLILDPFLFNVLPRSLAPTVGYIILVATASWFLAGSVSRALRGLILESNSRQLDTDGKKTQ